MDHPRTARRVGLRLALVLAGLAGLTGPTAACRSSGGDTDATTGGYGDPCEAADANTCDPGLSCMPDRGGATQCLLPCLAHADCADPLTGSATACWKCSSTVADWHCVAPGAEDCCAIACAHVYRDCNMTFTDGGGTPLDEAGCVDNCNLGTFDAHCMATAPCTSAGVDACRP